METCLKENKELESNNKKYKNERESDIKSDKIKKLKFLILCNLQFSAILSQLGLYQIKKIK